MMSGALARSRSGVVRALLLVTGLAFFKWMGRALLSFLGKGRNLGLRSFFLGTTIATRMPEIAPAFQALFAAFRDGDLHLPITRMPLTEVREAHRRIEAQETVGKVILEP